MIRSARSLALGVVAAAAFAGCSHAPHNITLASGSQLTVIEEKSDTYLDRHNAEKRTFSVEYQSLADFQDPAAVRSEMYEVFDYYKPAIDRGDYTKLELTPMKRDLGGGMEGLPFYLERRPSGRWIVL
jgi:hypothetical protein